MFDHSECVRPPLRSRSPALKPGQLVIELEDRELEATVVHLHGELDLATVPRFEGAIRDLSARGRPPVVLDLTGLTFMDCAGLRVLLAARAHARAIGSQLGFVLGDGCPRRLAEVTDTSEQLEADRAFAAQASWARVSQEMMFADAET